MNITKIIEEELVSDGKLAETIKADYFSILSRIDPAVFYEKAHYRRKYGTLLSKLTKAYGCEIYKRP